MSVVICPGIHDLELTLSFLAELRCEAGKRSRSQLFDALDSPSGDLLIFPAQDYPAFSAFHILHFLRERSNVSLSPLLFISFSAGVVGAIGAAWGWQLLGGSVKAFIAIDGWGVPLSGSFPLHRLSHDDFTHWSSSLLGGGENSFYADPPVDHLDLWRAPQTAQGWHISHSCVGTLPRSGLTATQFLTMLLERYKEG